MQASLFSTFIGMLLCAVMVLSTPTPARHTVEDIARRAEAPQASASASAAPKPPAGGAGTACSPAVVALASGISANIADQNNEVSTVTAISYILQENPVNQTLFTEAQTSLLAFVQKGIDIRKNNQAIAPAGNSAIAGLATVAMAQVEELNLTMGLGMGGVNFARDNATVTKLIADFNGGIGQNMKNLAASTTGCTI